MAFAVEDFQDLIRLLGERPEWRAELRREILTDELLTLPELVRQLAAAQERTEARLTELAAAQERTEARLRQLAEAMVLHGRRLDAHEDRLGKLDGRMLELVIARRFPAYFSPIARRLRLVDPAHLADLLDDSVDQGLLTAAERGAVLNADLVLTGRRRADDAEVYLVAEISVGIGPDDVGRALERARIVERLGRPVIPVVAGERISPIAEGLAQASGVFQALDGHIAAPEGQIDS